MIKQAVFRFLVLSCAVIGTACQRPHSAGGGNSHRVLWNDSKAQDARSYVVLLNPYWARERVEDHIHQSAYHVAMVGEWYLLTTSSGDEVSLTGYYVNGNTGAIEYRVARHDDFTYPATPKHLQFDSVKAIAPPFEHRVYWASNTAYEAYVPRLRVSPKEARAILNKHDTSPSYLQAVVDDCYVFSRPGDRTLSGYYVSGTTGAVEHRTARHELVNPPQQPGGLRFVQVKSISAGSLQ